MKRNENEIQSKGKQRVDGIAVWMRLNNATRMMQEMMAVAIDATC